MSIKEKKVVAIIQARMGSSRFPGKVLSVLAGKPVLWHIVHRVRKCRPVDEVVVATSREKPDDQIAQYCNNLEVKCVRGPENNVLARYERAVITTDPDVIVRITGDVPLVDPGMIENMLSALMDKQGDFCISDPDLPTIHEGFSCFTRTAFNKLVSEARQDPVAIEHVCGYFKQHSDFVKTVYADVAPDLRVGGVRSSIDTPVDLKFFETLYGLTGEQPGELSLHTVADLLQQKPELTRINADVYQKECTEQARRVLFRCDGSHTLGMGHVVRCLALGEELRQRHGVGVSFAVSEDEQGVDYLRAASFPVEGPKPAHLNEQEWMDQVIETQDPDAIVMDFRTGLSPKAVEQWRAHGRVVVTLDDPSDRRLAADHAFYPPVPQVDRLDWTGFRGELHAGWDWILLRRQFQDVQRNAREPQFREKPSVLVTMGGSDPAGLTLKAIAALNQLDVQLHTRIVLGPCFQHDTELANLLDHYRHPYEVLRNVSDMAGVMSRADLAVASFSVTAYELAAAGTPAVLLCLRPDDEKSAEPFAAEQIAIPLGFHKNVRTEQITDALTELLQKPEYRRRMACRAQAAIDGSGTRRTADAIAAAI